MSDMSADDREVLLLMSRAEGALEVYFEMHGSLTTKTLIAEIHACRIKFLARAVGISAERAIKVLAS